MKHSAPYLKLNRQDCGPKVSLAGVPSIPDYLRNRDDQKENKSYSHFKLLSEADKRRIDAIIAAATAEIQRRKRVAYEQQQCEQVRMRTDCSLPTWPRGPIRRGGIHST